MSSAPLLIRDGQLLGSRASGSLLIRDGRIAAMGAAARRAARRGTQQLDAEGLVVAPGYIELQINGAAGHDLTAEPDSLWTVASALPRYGVVAFLATVVSPAPETVEQILAVLRGGPPHGFHGARPIGLHVEGPLIHPDRRGAHQVRHLRSPDARITRTWTKERGVRLVTLAPELPRALSLIRRLRAGGVVVSAGHTTASFEQARAGFDAGVQYVTHLFNGMADLDHRAPGLVGAALGDERITVGLIADGVHVHPSVVALAWKLAGPGRVSLVSDATAGLGMPPGRYRLGPAVLEVDEASVRSGRRLAGGVLSLDACIRNLVRFAGADPADAAATVTRVPARLLGLRGLGALRVGGRADVTVLTPDLVVAATIIGGRLAHTTKRTAAWA